MERPASVAAFQAVKTAFKDPRLQLAAPLSVFIGLQQGFIHADFSKVSKRYMSPAQRSSFQFSKLTNLLYFFPFFAVVRGVFIGSAQHQPGFPEHGSPSIYSGLHIESFVAECTSLSRYR